MTAPLFDSLAALADSAPLRLHMPGHKGRLPGALEGAARLDFTEIAPTGNLYTLEGPIAPAEKLFARAAGARDALFFTCGSTQGIFTMLDAAVGLGGELLLDRGCHKSVWHGMGLLDITPRYLTPPRDPETGLPGILTPEMLDRALSQYSRVKAVLLTSPSYYGVITPLAPLREVCRNHGAYLLVDQAHGAHFPFVGLPSAAAEGADLAVVSAHKTLPALGSSSILYIGDGAPWSPAELKARAAIFATSSPSYPILASIDQCRALLEKEYAARYRDMAAQTALLREKIDRETPFRALKPGQGRALDPCRLTVDTLAGGLPGREADRLLQQDNIFLEMADERYIVAILTCMDTREDLLRLLSALKRLPAGPARLPLEGEPPAPVIRKSVRQGLFLPGEPVPLERAAGRVAGQIVAPYPPGIPVLAPGEEITEKHIAYLQKKMYNIKETVRVLMDPAEHNP